jgi:spermidine synthase
MIPLVLLSILPFCALLGYLTPMLVDHASQDHPERAGRAYAINITGSIAGPLVAAHLLLPVLGARLSMVVLALPFVALLVQQALQSSGRRRVAGALALAVCAAALFQTTYRGLSFEEGSHIRGAVVRRDHTATVISYGRGFNRMLLVNGYGMTVLTPLTKIMAHLPLASLDHPPRSALVIAFGMGTTFKSLLSWGIDATAVELVPSVIDAFGYYHADAEKVVVHPRGRIVVDDGRRFLARTGERFDLITIDPPPPVETAGSSLLYAEEFYAIAKRRLAPGGILQQWFPDAENVEPIIREAVLRSVVRSFEHIRVFQSLHGQGLHILASEQPISVPDAATFVSRLPAAARRDLMEWAPAGVDIRDYVRTQILDREIDTSPLLPGPEGPAITDDRPLNEYFVLRRLRER